MPETNIPALGEVKTYEPDDVLKRGYPAIFKGIFFEIGRNRWLTWQLFKRDFLATYKQSLFGVFWALIIPLISVGTFVLLNHSGILSVGKTDAPYPIFAVLGMLMWQLFSSGLIGAANSLVKAGAMIVKINFSKKSLVLASLGQSLVSGLIQLMLLLSFFIAYKYAPTWYIFILPFLILPLAMLTVGFGFILSILNGVARDIGNILAISLTFLMFLTPVLYVKPQLGIMSVLTKYNILYYLIAVPRDLVMSGQTRDLFGYAVCSIIAVFTMFICLAVFHFAETRVTERI